MKNPFPVRSRAVRRHNRHGFTLSELAIVIGIIGLIIGAIWVAARAVNERTAVNQAVQTLQTISHNMVTLYQNRALPASCGDPTTGNITSNLIDAGVVPGSIVSGVDALGCKEAVHPWDLTPGRLIVWGPPNAGAGVFRVAFYNVPLDACIALLLQATSCDPIQPGCPFHLFTDFTAVGHEASNAAGPPPNWQDNMNPAIAAGLCAFNPVPGGSVEIEYRL